MNLESLPSATLIILVSIVAGLGIWYLAVWLNQPRLKAIAAVIGVFPLLGFGLQLTAHFFNWGSPPDTYTTSTPGPASREASVTRDFPFPVTDHTVAHEVELTPRAGVGKAPAGSIPLVLVVRSPNGEKLVDMTGTLAPGQGQFWVPLRTRFQPLDEGEHTMHLEIPAGVDEVKVKVRELRN
ncbi:MAG: hypothetical protein LAO79_26100 [Acidobacteriia bacterium]|nr:hypothetical protein [Terriglobia bacterium]